MALDELCLNCSKKTLKGFESVMNRLEGKHGTKTSLGEKSYFFRQERMLAGLDQSGSSGSWVLDLFWRCK